MSSLTSTPPIDPATTLGSVSLRVADIDRSLALYEAVLGFRVLKRDAGRAVLGTEDGRELVILHEIDGARPSLPNHTGLYHLAVLLPTRADLGKVLARVLDAGVPLGQADHLVSEALYLTDPDGNGIELYRDRPRSQWTWENGSVRMAVDRLDLRNLRAEGTSDPTPWAGLPSGTAIGHVHLRVGDLNTAERFYHNVLGFDVVAKMPGALFVSAGGYHHHLGLNAWESRGGTSAGKNEAGLDEFTVLLPTSQALEATRTRLQENGSDVIESGNGVTALDPWTNKIRFTVG